MIMKTKTNRKYVFGSMTRITNLDTEPFSEVPLTRNEWETGDYVVGRYLGKKDGNYIENEYLELSTGRLRPLVVGDFVVGVLGTRFSTQEIVGDWHMIGADNLMHDLLGSGVFGYETSCSSRYPSSASFMYQGHVVRPMLEDARTSTAPHTSKVCMKHFVPEQVQTKMLSPTCPMVLIVGTAMSCGKTATGHSLLQILKQELGFERVAGAKFTGGGYRHDTQAMSDAGADFVCDFVDAGLPSTVMSPDDFRTKGFPTIMGILSEYGPDCVVAEIGASPCEPYNGKVVLEELLGSYRPQKLFIVLCASDAYSVVGIQHLLSKKETGIDFQPDVVCGIAANTTAAITMIHDLSGLPALSLTTKESREEMRKMLQSTLLDDDEADV